jgi:hypothetical protein
MKNSTKTNKVNANTPKQELMMYFLDKMSNEKAPTCISICAAECESGVGNIR